MEIVIRKRTSCSSRTGLMHFAVRKVRSLHRGTCHRATVVNPGRPTLERIGQRELQCFGKRWSTSVQALADQEKEAPEFIPAEYLADIGDQAAQDMARQMRRAEVEVPGLGVVDTAYVPPAERDEAHDPERMNRSPVCLLHGFDSSSLEFRRLVPLLDRSVRTWAVDVVGWGFSDYSRFLDNSVDSLTPQQKREHLYAFWKQHIGEPMVLVGASLGGTIALDFVLHHPEAVDRVVAIDAQGFVDGLGLMSKLPPALSRVGVGVLRAIWLRQAANKQAYYNKEVFATDDAMKVGRLHTHLPGWTEANMAFMRGGGYAISERLPQVPVPVLVMWGRQDEILDPENAERFLQVLPQARLVWMEECGHCAHLEKPEQCAAEILGFMAS